MFDRDWDRRHFRERLEPSARNGNSLVSASSRFRARARHSHPNTFRNGGAYGVFFFATAICLIQFGLALITDAIDPRYMPGTSIACGGSCMPSGAVGNISILGLYLPLRERRAFRLTWIGSVESVVGVDLVAKDNRVVAAWRDWSYLLLRNTRTTVIGRMEPVLPPLTWRLRVGCLRPNAGDQWRG